MWYAQKTAGAKQWQPGAPVQDLNRLPKKGLKLYMRAPKVGAEISDAAVLAGSEACMQGRVAQVVSK